MGWLSSTALPEMVSSLSMASVAECTARQIVSFLKVVDCHVFCVSLGLCLTNYAGVLEALPDDWNLADLLRTSFGDVGIVLGCVAKRHGLYSEMSRVLKQIVTGFTAKCSGLYSALGVLSVLGAQAGVECVRAWLEGHTGRKSRRVSQPLQKD